MAGASHKWYVAPQHNLLRFASRCRSLLSQMVTHLPQRSLGYASFATLTSGKGANGGCGGKAAKLPAPPTATQRTFMGRGGPEGLRCHMSPKGV